MNCSSKIIENKIPCFKRVLNDVQTVRGSMRKVCTFGDLSTKNGLFPFSFNAHCLELQGQTNLLTHLESELVSLDSLAPSKMSQPSEINYTINSLGAKSNRLAFNTFFVGIKESKHNKQLNTLASLRFCESIKESYRRKQWIDSFRFDNLIFQNDIKFQKGLNKMTEAYRKERLFSFIFFLT